MYDVDALPPRATSDPEWATYNLRTWAWERLGLTGEEFAAAWLRGDFDGDPRPWVQQLGRLVTLVGALDGSGGQRQT